MLQVQLKVVGGKHDGRIISITSPKFLIGREQDCHLRPNSDLVSRHHCVMTVDNYTLRLRDLGSTNGTFVNGERMRGELQLKAGDLVAVGKLQFEIQLTEVQPEAEPATSEDTVTNGIAAQSEETVHIDQNPEAPAAPQQPPAAPEQPAAPGADSLTAPPNVGGGDTTIFQMPAMPQYQPAPGMPPQPGQPPMPGYPMPGYPMQQPYPVPGYPQPGAVYPPAGAPPEAPAQPPEGQASITEIPLRLPTPGETGYREPEKVQKPVEQGESEESEEKPSQSAADIIKQYMNQRPGGA